MNRLLIFLLSSLMVATTAVHLSANSIGSWLEDANGLPAYALSARLPIETKDATGKPYPVRNDPVFLLGNSRLTLFVHGSGILQFLSGERAWARLNAAGNSYGSNRAVLRTGNATFTLVGLDSLAADPQVTQRTFGTGYAIFAHSLPNDLKLERRIDVRASPTVETGEPGCVISVTFENRSSQLHELEYEESIDAKYESMIDRLKPEEGRLVRYSNQVEAVSNGVRVNFLPSSTDPTALRDPSQDSRYDSAPPSLALLGVPDIANASREFFTHPAANGGTSLVARVKLSLQPGERQTIRFVAGLIPRNDLKPLSLLRTFAAAHTFEQEVRTSWAAKIPAFSKAPDAVLRREMKWHAYTLQAMATYNEYYRETYIPQGQTYDYEMDLTAAPRDHLQHNLPLSYFAPDLAKANLRFVLKRMTKQGEIPYTAFGYGRTSNSAWNTSDQQLYLFLAIGDYLRVTKDYAFLNDLSEYNPMPGGFSGTLLDKLESAFVYLRDEVGTGPHGLVRLMNSDWSDMIYSDTPIFAYFWTAESHMNSAMVLAVFPELIRQLEAAIASGKVTETEKARTLSRALSVYLDKMRTAFLKDYEGRTFSRRLYFNATAAWGDDNMHIEPQSYLLLADDFRRDQKEVLWAEVQRRILKDEPIGARQRETPIAVAKYDAGTGENGGVWFALAGPMIVGVSTFDREEAWKLLRRISLDNYARNYPDYWVGQWTSAECFNSVITGPIAGLPRTGDNWTWTSFPVFCAHAHAWPLYAYLRLVGDAQ